MNFKKLLGMIALAFSLSANAWGYDEQKLFLGLGGGTTSFSNKLTVKASNALASAQAETTETFNEPHLNLAFGILHPINENLFARAYFDIDIGSGDSIKKKMGDIMSALYAYSLNIEGGYEVINGFSILTGLGMRNNFLLEPVGWTGSGSSINLTWNLGATYDINDDFAISASLKIPIVDSKKTYKLDNTLLAFYASDIRSETVYALKATTAQVNLIIKFGSHKKQDVQQNNPIDE